MRCTWVLVLAVACSKSKPKEEPAASPPTATSPAPAVVAAPADASVVADAAAVKGDAAVAEVACTVDALKQLRKTADAHVKAGAPDKAVVLLDSVSCFLEEEQDAALNEQIAWSISDHAFALYKAGKHEDCYRVAESQLQPYRGNVAEVFGDDTKVVKALSYNSGLCRKAAEKKRGTFVERGPCALGDGIGFPGDPNTCLDIGEMGHTIDEDGNQDRECGAISLLEPGKGGKPARTALTVEGDHDANLSDASVCCNNGSITFQKRGTTWALLVTTEGENCQGGTARTSEEHVYELRGDKLVLVHKLDAAYH